MNISITNDWYNVHLYTSMLFATHFLCSYSRVMCSVPRWRVRSWPHSQTRWAFRAVSACRSQFTTCSLCSPTLLRTTFSCLPQRFFSNFYIRSVVHELSGSQSTDLPIDFHLHSKHSYCLSVYSDFKRRCFNTLWSIVVRWISSPLAISITPSTWMLVSYALTGTQL